jgi:hypothetical protein
VILCVSGTGSGAGKTRAVETVLQAAEGRAAAVKFTTTSDVPGPCPHGAPCVVCESPAPFRILDGPAVLGVPGTDTGRMSAAGAASVLWVITRASAARAAWTELRARLEARAPAVAVVVIEGSTVAGLAQPDARLFVVHPHQPPQRWKPGSPALLTAADLAIVNRPAADPRPPAPAVLATAERLRAGRPLLVTDLALPLSAWAPALAARLAAAAPLGPSGERRLTA